MSHQRTVWFAVATIAASAAAGSILGAFQGPSAAAIGSDPHMAQIVKEVSPTRIKDIDTKLVSFGTRSALSEPESTDTRGIVPARKWIASQFQAISDANGGRLKVSIDTFDVPQGSRIPAAQTMSNVVAVLPGTDPNDHRIFLVGGHYDSIPGGPFTQDAPGANDDASGTIVSLECARALAPYQFPATIEFFTYEGEEEGLYGSTHAAKVAKDAGQEIAGVLNDDIVGGDQTPGNDNTDRIRGYGEGLSPLLTQQQITDALKDGLENDSPSRELVRYIQMVATRYVPNFHVIMEYREDRFHRDSDHHAWLNAGFPYTMTFREWSENSNHQHVAPRTDNGIEYGDLEKWVGFDYLANVARVNAVTLASLASSPLAPEHVTFHAGQQMGNTIKWTPVAGTSKYVLLYRGTADPQWSERVIEGQPAPPPAAAATGSAPAGAMSGAPAGASANATPMLQVNIKESGDTYIFAVAAVDAQGHESLPRVAVAEAAGRGGAGRGGAGRGGARGGGGGGGGE